MFAHHRDHDHDGHCVFTGRTANATFWHDFFEAVPDAEVVLDGLAVSGDEVLGRLMLRGTHTGASLGIPASGRTIALREIDIWHVSDSILASRWDDLQETALFRQLSSMRPPEDPTA